MISISTVSSSIEIGGIKEREPESMPMLMARVTFSGQHFLPINHIPRRIFGMQEDQFRIFGHTIPYVFRGEAKDVQPILSALYRNVEFFGTDMVVFATGEELEDSDKGLMTVMDIPFFQFSIPQHIFLDVDKLARDLVQYAEVSGTPISADQIQGLATLKKNVQVLESSFQETSDV
jgi:hypothetical protein